MVIDVHAHYLPDSVVAALRLRGRAPAITTLETGEQRRLMPAGHTLPFSPETYTDMAARLAFMDAHGIHHQVLSMGLLFGVHCLPLEEAAPLARLFNDDLGDLCRRHPDRFSGLALLPMADMGAAVDELGRAVSACGLSGAILPANCLIDRHEAENLRPLLVAAEALSARLFIHPGQRPDEFAAAGARIYDNLIARQALDVQGRLASAASTLLFTDLLDSCPDLVVHVANLGGTLPAVIERMDQMAKLRAPDAKLPSARVRRILVDCASLGPRAIEQAVAVFGADRVMFGSDCPIFRTDWTLAAVRDARLSDHERALVLDGTARGMVAPSPARAEA